MYCLNISRIAIELAVDDPAYEDLALKFYEHFLSIAHAMSHRGRDGMSLWDEEDGFFYDVLHLADGEQRPDQGALDGRADPALRGRGRGRREGRPAAGLQARACEWFVENRPDLAENVAPMRERGRGSAACSLSVVKPEQLRRILQFMLDENEFLSPHGIRSVSKVPPDHPYTMSLATGTTTARLRAGRIDGRALRRQLELARAGLDAAELPPDRGAPAVRLLSRRRLHGGVPDGLRQDDDAVGGGGGALASAHPPLPARRRAAAGRSTAAARSSDATRTGATCCSSTSTSTATTAAGSAPATRRAGRRSSPSSLQQSGASLPTEAVPQPPRAAPRMKPAR